MSNRLPNRYFSKIVVGCPWHVSIRTGADLGEGCRGCAPSPEMTCGFLIQLVFCKKKKLRGLLVLKKSAPPPKKNPGSAPAGIVCLKRKVSALEKLINTCSGFDKVLETGWYTCNTGWSVIPSITPETHKTARVKRRCTTCDVISLNIQRSACGRREYRLSIPEWSRFCPKITRKKYLALTII